MANSSLEKMPTAGLAAGETCNHESQPLRLNRALAKAGLASRRGAEQLIAQGKVRLNGEVATSPATMVIPSKDRLQVMGHTVSWQENSKTQVWALYKPKGVVSTLKDPQGRRCLADMLPQTSIRLFPVGRLDYDAQGLILLTNDGQLAQRLTHPSYCVRKIYLVKVRGKADAAKLAPLRKGMMLDGRRCAPIYAKVLHHRSDKTWLELTLREGIHHHIKKALAQLGFAVLKITRCQIGSILLDVQALPGQARLLTAAELVSLQQASLRKTILKKNIRQKLLNKST